MAMSKPTIHFALPGLSPVGGVIKLMDYVQHARDTGHDAVIVVHQRFDPEAPLFTQPRFRDFQSWGVPIVPWSDMRMRDGDFYVFSWPPTFSAVEHFLPWMKTERVIHIIQGIRHTYPEFLDGYGLRLLSRPMTRIAISDHVRSAIAPHVNISSILRTIPLAHPTDFFDRRRSERDWHDPIRVAYTTWKSDAGVAVERELADDPRFEFRSIRSHVEWQVVREMYHWADVFLCCPRIQEGFHLPGLEAMAAQCIVVTPDVLGNREYCLFGTNCIEVEWSKVESYKAALHRIAAMRVAERMALRTAGATTAGSRQLTAERTAFAALLAELQEVSVR
jgi:hypothetical protein